MGAVTLGERTRRAIPGRDSDVRVVAPVSLQVRDLLRDHGFVVGDILGTVNEHTGDDVDNVWGILLPVDVPEPKRLLGFQLPVEQPRRPFIGRICMDYPGPNAWTLDVYGRQYIERMQQLALEMSRKFGKKIDVKLIKETPDVEHRFEDIDFF